MEKDIKIPKVQDVYIAVINEYNAVYKTHDWNAYIINDKHVDLDIVLIVTQGHDNDKTTSIMRHKLDKLPKKSYAKIELMHEDILELNNLFKVTFFENNQMFDKTYTFLKNTINSNKLQKIPLMKIKGVLAK